MTASACLTLALIHWFIWWRQRRSWPNLAFMVTAISAAAFAACEFAMMKAQNTREYAVEMRWAHVPVFLIILSLCVFVKLYCRAGRPWLMWSACGLRALSLVLNFTTGQTLNYSEITSLRHIALFGDPIVAADGALNPWIVVGNVSLFLFMIFVADAAITVWKRGDRRLALSVGGSILFFAVAGTTQALCVFWGHAQWPITTSLFYLGIVVAMSYELGNEALNAARLARELQEAETELRSNRERVAHVLRVASLGELSSALAHELNQPLMAIMSNAQAAQRFLAKDKPDLAEIRDILNDIVADDERASEVINRLRKLLKSGVSHSQAISIESVVEDVLKLMRGDLSSRDVTVATELDARLPLVSGDPVQLQQVLINLILNAADSMSESKTRVLTIRSKWTEGDPVTISVIDTGCGIASGDEEKVFEAYHTSKDHGLGLGLSLSRSIVQAHGGKLWAESYPGGGTSLSFTISEVTGRSR